MLNSTKTTHSGFYCPLVIQNTLAGFLIILLCGCWAPLLSPGIPASQLPETYRTPNRTAGKPLNYASLTVPATGDYLLGPGDILDITVFPNQPIATVRPLRVQINSGGEIYLPQIGSVPITGLTLLQANKEIQDRYERTELYAHPVVNITLQEKTTTSVVVMGEVLKPGVLELNKYENDVPHAVASAGGLTEDADDEIEVHRRELSTQLQRMEVHEALQLVEPGSSHQLANLLSLENTSLNPSRIVHIPLRGDPTSPIRPEDLTLHDGDVVMVRSRKDQVFYVTGPLARLNFVRFNVGGSDRDLGSGFLLPRDREIDVVTAVAMAGYIDPIDSPTTVTIHRADTDGNPHRIVVDLMKARYDRKENLFIEPGDIIYLIPDFGWWFRRSFDRLVNNNLFRFSLSHGIQ